MLSLRWGKPLIAVDHIQAHLQAACLEQGAAQLPSHWPGGLRRPFAPLPGPWPTELELIGGTIDDAAGEAFDKAAAILDLGYPGGPIIDRLAQAGNPKALSLPRSLLHSGDLRLILCGPQNRAALSGARPTRAKPPHTRSTGHRRCCCQLSRPRSAMFSRKKALKACLRASKAAHYRRRRCLQ